MTLMPLLNSSARLCDVGKWLKLGGGGGGGGGGGRDHWNYIESILK